MSRTVFCRKYQQEMEGLSAPHSPGPKGQEIFDHVSKQAWSEWLAHQTLLINERRLNLMDPQTRKFLQEEMDKFLSGGEFAQAEGYVPPPRK
jgi:Fe-S cluster biosynthesis and repair protein YggX